MLDKKKKKKTHTTPGFLIFVAYIQIQVHTSRRQAA